MELSCGLTSNNPSPGPLRLVKAPAAGHPLPWGEGRRFEMEVRVTELYARMVAYRRGVVKHYFRSGGTPQKL